VQSFSSSMNMSLFCLSLFNILSSIFSFIPPLFSSLYRSLFYFYFTLYPKLTSCSPSVPLYAGQCFTSVSYLISEALSLIHSVDSVLTSNSSVLYPSSSQLPALYRSLLRVSFRP
jgi:hypothetical protein